MRVSGDRPPPLFDQRGAGGFYRNRILRPGERDLVIAFEFAPRGVQRLMELKKQGLNGSSQTG
jgi:hypothetical protein